MFNFQLKVCMPWHAESFAYASGKTERTSCLFLFTPLSRHFHIRLRTCLHYIKSKSQQKQHLVYILSLFRRFSFRQLLSIVKYSITFPLRPFDVPKGP